MYLRVVALHTHPNFASCTPTLIHTQAACLRIGSIKSAKVSFHVPWWRSMWSKRFRDQTKDVSVVHQMGGTCLASALDVIETDLGGGVKIGLAEKACINAASVSKNGKTASWSMAVGKNSACTIDIDCGVSSWWFHGSLEVTGSQGSVCLTNFIEPHYWHSITTTLPVVGSFSEKAYGRQTPREGAKKTSVALKANDYMLFEFTEAVRAMEGGGAAAGGGEIESKQASMSSHEDELAEALDRARFLEKVAVAARKGSRQGATKSEKNE